MRLSNLEKEMIGNLFRYGPHPFVYELHNTLAKKKLCTPRASGKVALTQEGYKAFIKYHLTTRAKRVLKKLNRLNNSLPYFKNLDEVATKDQVFSINSLIDNNLVTLKLPKRNSTQIQVSIGSNYFTLCDALRDTLELKEIS